MLSFDLRRKNWLIPFFREVSERAVAAPVEHFEDAEGVLQFDAWLLNGLSRRGLLSSAPTAIWPLPDAGLEPKDRGEWHFLNSFAHQLELLFELRSALGLGSSTVRDQLAIMEVIAAHVGCFDEAEQLFEVSLDLEALSLADWPEDPTQREKLTKAMGPAARAVGSKLKELSLQSWDHPLLGLPLHGVLVYTATCQLLRIAHFEFRKKGRVDESQARFQRAQAQVERLHLIEAIFALANADLVLTRVERRLVDNVISLARLSSEEQGLIWQGVKEPVSATELGKLITDPQTRRFLFAQLVIQGYLDGEFVAQEQAFIEQLGQAFGISQEERLIYQAEALSTLENNPLLIEAFSLGGLVRRFSSGHSASVERVISSNLSRLVLEIRETGELAQLLVKRAQGPLSPEEEAKIRQQIIDICKTIPALAVFAAPGGTFILPIIMRLLPFDLMPSAFTEKDESL